MIAPNSIIHLLNIPIDDKQDNQLYFANRTDQYNYMYSKKLHTFTNFVYQRKDGYVRVPKHIDSLWNVNYIMYNNIGDSTRWFYGFITKLEYVSDSVTNVYIKTDVYQTWFTDVTYKSSFIEREHVSIDTVGLHTLPENLELGEYIPTDNADITSMSSSHVVVGTSSMIEYLLDEETADPEISTMYNGINGGLVYSVLEDNTALSFLVAALANKGKIDALLCVFMCPDSLSNISSGSWKYIINGTLSYGGYKEISSSNTATLLETKTITKPLSTINGYTPKNKKLYTYPYQYLLIDNNNGSSGIFPYEYFNNSSMSFKIKGAITPGCSIRCIPQSYKNQTENNLEGLNSGKFPVCSWASDIYTNWLSQNGLNIGIDIASSALQIVGGASLMSTGGGGISGAGSITSGLINIANSLGQIYQHQMIPPQVQGNINSGDITYSDDKMEFSFYKMSIKEEYAKIIDQYFDMYGYKVNTVKIPSFTSRSHWNYIKTINCNIIGNIPEEDLIIYKDLFDKGITFWKNASEIGNYSLDNSL